MKKVRLGAFSFDADVWKNVSQDARILIRNLMKIKPNERYTAEHALNHDWCQNHAPNMTSVMAQSTSTVLAQTAASQSALREEARSLSKQSTESTCTPSKNSSRSPSKVSPEEMIDKAMCNEPEFDVPAVSK